MARKLDYRWHLRQVMAAHGMFVAVSALMGPTVTEVFGPTLVAWTWE